MITYQNLFAFWPMEWFKTNDPIPPYVLQHPLMDETKVYGVGSGKNFLEAKSKALNDIATQLQSDVRSITSVHKNSSELLSQTDQQITVLTKRKIDNFSVVREDCANGLTYLLVEYKRTPGE
jgi:hypothetical protein